MHGTEFYDENRVAMQRLYDAGQYSLQVFCLCNRSSNRTVTLTCNHDVCKRCYDRFTRRGRWPANAHGNLMSVFNYFPFPATNAVCAENELVSAKDLNVCPWYCIGCDGAVEHQQFVTPARRRRRSTMVRIVTPPRSASPSPSRNRLADVEPANLLSFFDQVVSSNAVF